MAESCRIGIDLGGTKTEVIVLHQQQVLLRCRQPTPSSDYQAILQNIVSLVERASAACPADAELLVGIGMPGALTPLGLVKNSNTVCLNGQPFQRDIEQLLQLPVSIMNDANCFALSEAVDGAAAGADSVFGVILGTGVGGGLVLGQQPLTGANAIAGEWGHAAANNSAEANA